MSSFEQRPLNRIGRVHIRTMKGRGAVNLGCSVCIRGKNAQRAAERNTNQ